MLQLRVASFELWQLFALPFRFVSAISWLLMKQPVAQNCCIVCHPLNMQTANEDEDEDDDDGDEQPCPVFKGVMAMYFLNAVDSGDDVHHTEQKSIIFGRRSLIQLRRTCDSISEIPRRTEVPES